MPDDPLPLANPSVEELIERSRRLREASDKLSQEMRELEALILATATKRVGAPQGKPGGKSG